MWMLDDFSEDNGATLVVPGSHMSGCQPSRYPGGAPQPVPATAPAGTAMVFEGRLWHGTGANRGNTPRRGLLSTFCGPQFRPQENYTIGTRPEVLEAATDDLRALLGFRVFSGYGRTDSPLVDMVDPHAAPVGIMRPRPAAPSHCG
jgi:ectoine hydroxylase-related dioxygenase (phytanoyl-CoA dioxygenase family)